MKTMIQIAILTVILAPAASYADPRVAKPVKHPTGALTPVRKHHPKPPPKPGPIPRPTPGPKPGPKPGPVPPTPPPGHHKHHHHHHHQPQVIYFAAASSWGRPAVQTITYNNTQPLAETPATGRALTTREFLQGRAGYAGQRVAVCGKVTQSVRGMDGVDYLILDGVVRCEFPSGARMEANRYVTVVGTVTGGWHATASADLAKCDRLF